MTSPDPRSPLDPLDPLDLHAAWERNRLQREQDGRYEQWVRSVRANPISGGLRGLLLVLYTIAVVVTVMVLLGVLMSGAGVSGFRGRPSFLFAVPGVLAGIGFFLFAGRLFYHLGADAPPGPRRAARWFVGLTTVALLAAGGVAAARLAPTVRRAMAADDYPADFFERATADFAEARRHLADGRLADGTAKYLASQEHRFRASGVQVASHQTFGQWCDAREQEYRDAAAGVCDVLPMKVGAAAVTTGRPALAEADDFIRRFGNDASRAVWEAQRPSLSRRVAAAAADRAYRLEWTSRTAAGEGVGIDDEDYETLVRSLRDRLGAPIIPASAARDVDPARGLGTIHVTLVFADPPTAALTAAVTATVEVTTHAAPGRWDGTHRFTAAAPADAPADPGSRQRILLRDVVKQIRPNDE